MCERAAACKKGQEQCSFRWGRAGSAAGVWKKQLQVCRRNSCRCVEETAAGVWKKQLQVCGRNSCRCDGAGAAAGVTVQEQLQV